MAEITTLARFALERLEIRISRSGWPGAAAERPALLGAIARLHAAAGSAPAVDVVNGIRDLRDRVAALEAKAAPAEVLTRLADAPALKAALLERARARRRDRG